MRTRFSVPVPSGSGAHPLHLGSGYRVSFKVVKLITCCMNFKCLKLSQCIYVTFLCVLHLQCHIIDVRTFISLEINTYPRCIRRRSILGHIFQGKKVLIVREIRYTSLYKCLDSQIMDF